MSYRRGIILASGLVLAIGAVTLATAQAPAGAQGLGKGGGQGKGGGGRGGGAPLYTPAPGAKDLKAVLFNWGGYMGMLRKQWKNTI